MKTTRRVWWIAAIGLMLAIAAPIGARGQLFGVGFPSPGYGSGYNSGYGYRGGYGYPSYGYGVRTGLPGQGYGAAFGINQNRYIQPARTTVVLQPLYSAITSLPGWDGPTGGGVPRRVRHYRRPVDPPIPHFDRNGNILWPGMIVDDPGSTALRRSADDAFRAVYHESQTTGHASIRPVIAAKRKLSAYERAILPAINGRSVADGDNLERFFVDLNRSIDGMNSVF